MTPEDQAIYDDLAERIRAVDGSRPNKSRWIEYACHLIRTQQALISGGLVGRRPRGPVAPPKYQVAPIVSGEVANPVEQAP